MISFEKILADQVYAFGEREAITDLKMSLTFSQLQKAVINTSNKIIKSSIPEKSFIYLDINDNDWCHYCIGYLSIVYAGHIAILSCSNEKLLGFQHCLIGPSDENKEFEFEAIDIDEISYSFTKNLKADDPLDVVFSSGTTGKVKPILSERNQWLEKKAIKLPKMKISALHFGIPFRTATGVHGIFIRHFLGGITSHYLKPDNWNHVIEITKRHQFFELSTSPYGIAKINSTDFTAPTKSKFNQIRIYAGPLSQEMRSNLQNKFKSSKIYSIYGLTEGGSSSLISTGSSTSFQPGNMKNRFRVVKEDKISNTKDGEIGLIVVKATDRDHNLASISIKKTEQWIETGDLGRMNIDGSIDYIGRVKDMIIVDGERRSASNMEEEFNTNLKNAESLYFNFNNKKGEALGVILECDEEFSIADIEKTIIGDYIFLLSHFHRTEIGKIIRHKCVAEISDKMYSHFSLKLQDMSEFSPKIVDLREKI